VRRSSLASRIDIVALAMHPDRVQEVLDSLKLSDAGIAVCIFQAAGVGLRISWGFVMGYRSRVV
jgi:hypothetical protein